jgi:arylsulfatase A-like enzyme
VHSPWQAKKDLIEKYRARKDPQGGTRNPVYGAMVESMDQALGRLMRTLDETGVADNTIVVFFSDNGGVFWAPGEGPGFMNPGYGDIPITSNAPLRDGKATLYEGGTREPCVVVWPGKVKPGTRNEQLVSSVDFHPTLLEAAGVKLRERPRFDGMSFLPAWRGEKAPRDTVFCHFPHYSGPGAKPASYVRKNDWKLIRFYFDSDDQTDRFELYNLREDLGETRNLAGERPAQVKELSALLDAFLHDTKAVLPKKNPDYRPKARKTAAEFNQDELA